MMTFWVNCPFKSIVKGGKCILNTAEISQEPESLHRKDDTGTERE